MTIQPPAQPPAPARTAITTQRRAGNTFAVSDADRRAAAALRMMLPYGDKLTDDNALALLYYGRLHGLDPLNGECYFIVTEKTNERGEVIKREEKGCSPGIKGKRKQAKKQSPYKVAYQQVKPDLLGLNPDTYAVCMRAELRDDKSTGEYILNVMRLATAGFPKEEIERILGAPPVVTGYGAVRKTELNYLKQPPMIVARKRAESDAISQRFDLPIGELADDIDPGFVSGMEAQAEPAQGEDEQAVEGFYTQPEETGQPAEPPAHRPTEQELMNDLGY